MTYEVQMNHSGCFFYYFGASFILKSTKIPKSPKNQTSMFISCCFCCSRHPQNSVSTLIYYLIKMRNGGFKKLVISLPRKKIEFQV